MTSFFSNPLKYILNNWLPQDSNDSAGWGPFRLPSPECDWMQEGARVHDYQYEHSGDRGNDMRASESDGQLFRNWCRAAEAEFDPLKKCKRYAQICKYWPYVRLLGPSYLWDENENDKQKGEG